MSLSILNQLEHDSQIFKGKKIVVVGDIALDRTFLCRTPPLGLHGKYGTESIYDIEQDDFGTVGSANNTCLFWKTMGAEAVLVTAIGDDEEGRRVEKVLKRGGIRNKCFKLDGVQTISKFRFFVYSEDLGGYDLIFRVDKEPDYDLSYSKVEQHICKPEFLNWLKQELATADVLLLNDLEKGLLSAESIRLLAQLLKSINEQRENNGHARIITVVDPKYGWSKFIGFPIDVLVPNEREASREAGVTKLDFSRNDDRRILAEHLYIKYGSYFTKILVTLGRHGAILLDMGKENAQLFHFPEIPSQPSQFHISTHCGDMFGAGLALGLALREEIESATTFATYIGSLQFTKLTGAKVTRDDVLSEKNLMHVRQCFRPRQLLAEITDSKEQVINDILAQIKDRIDYRSALYRNSNLIASREFALELDKLSRFIRPGGIVFIHGESGTGKGAILTNMSVFIQDYDEKLDCYNAYDALDTPSRLEEIIKIAEERKTCIILDEIQSASDSGITKLLTAFPQQGFKKPFCLICAGHYSEGREALQDLFYRASQFEILPYRHPVRRHDLPFLIAEVLRSSDLNWQWSKITAPALREMLRCDYESKSSKNWRALKTVLMASCENISGDTLDWEHVNLKSIGAEKAKHKPMRKEWDYVIKIKY